MSATENSELIALERVLVRLLNHCAPRKARMIMSVGADMREEILYDRFALIEGRVKLVLAQVGKIRAVAQKHGCTEIIDLLDEPILNDSFEPQNDSHVPI